MPCHVSWRPSCWGATAIVLLGLAAAWALWASDFLPQRWALLAAGLAVLYSFWRWRAYLAQPVRELCWQADGTLLLDTVRLSDVRLHWRGPLVVLQWRQDGRLQALDFWSDTLSRSQRRALYLANSQRDNSRLPSTMAT